MQVGMMQHLLDDKPYLDVSGEHFDADSTHPTASDYHTILPMELTAGGRLAVDNSAEGAVHDKFSVFSSQFSVKTDF